MINRLPEFIELLDRLESVPTLKDEALLRDVLGRFAKSCPLELAVRIGRLVAEYRRGELDATSNN